MTTHDLGRAVVRTPEAARFVSAWTHAGLARSRARARASTRLTLNPIGAPLAHAAMHTAAVVHSYETAVFLPPHQ
jgi:hypothetical protein